MDRKLWYFSQLVRVNIASVIGSQFSVEVIDSYFGHLSILDMQ